MTGEQQAPGLGVIESAAIYPLPIFKKMAGLSDWALRQAKRDGLNVRTCGRRSYIVGADWATYLAQDRLNPKKAKSVVP